MKNKTCKLILLVASLLTIFSESIIVFALESNITNSSSVNNISSSLNSFYLTLEKTTDYIYETNKFNCSSSGCIASNYSNIGLISTYEYEQINKKSSYLRSSEEFFSINSNTIKIITSSGVKNTSSSSNSGIRPVLYLKNDINVIGTGSSNDPYMFSEKGDIILASASLNGASLKNFPSMTDPYIINKVICTNGAKGYFDEERDSIRLTKIKLPTSCVIDFKAGNTVSLTAINGTITKPSSKVVGRTGTTSFNVYASSGYTTSGATYSCTNGAIPTLNGNTLNIKNIKKDTECKITFVPTLKTKILADNPNKLERTDFNSVLGTSIATNDTIYKASGKYTEDGSEVYYFAGNVSNNWVKFGKDENNKDLYWRIIRTNEDGSIRLLYAGTSPSTTEWYIQVEGVDRFYFSAAINPYVASGYMYGTEGSLANNRLNTNSSLAKTKIDTWYSKGLNVKTDSAGNTYDKYVSRTAIYCNDRSGDGYKIGGTMYYATYNRLNLSKSPSYACGMKPDKSGLYSDANVADKFSASTTKGGNGKLTYPVALMTADEMAMAGGKYSTDNQYAYYYLNSVGQGVIKQWWLLSPYSSSSGTYGKAYIFGTYPENIYTFRMDSLLYLRPVISLKSCAAYKSGNGSSSSPYEVFIDSTCASQEN